MSLTEQIFILIGTLWATIIAFIIYMWVLQNKQQLILRFIAQRLAEIEKHMPKEEQKKDKQEAKPFLKKQETVVTINKNEPMSKYETVNLPDEAEIKFVD